MRVCALREQVQVYQSRAENVVSAAGAHHHASEEELRRIIRDAGFIPKQRDTLYRAYFLN